MAESIGERAIGLILSGTGSDGTRGVRAINEAGGLVLVQDPETAEFDVMARSAIGTGMEDYGLRPRELARAIDDDVTSAPGGLIKSAAKSNLAATLQEITAIVARGERISPAPRVASRSSIDGARNNVSLFGIRTPSSLGHHAT